MNRKFVVEIELVNNSNNTKAMKWIFVVISLLSFSCLSKAEGKVELTLYLEQFSPYNYEQNGHLYGINYDYVQAICERAKVKCRFKLLPWARAFHLAQTIPNSGVFSTSRNIEREQLFQWVGPLISSDSHFYRLKRAHHILVEKEADLLHYTVAAPREDIYYDVLIDMGYVANQNLLSVSSKNEGTRLFMVGKIDFLIANSLTLPYHRGVEMDVIEQVWPLEIPQLQGNYLALNKQVDNAIVERLNEAVELLEKEGIRQALIEKYTKQ